MSSVNTNFPSAAELRYLNKLEGKRPEVSLQQLPIQINGPSLDKAPKGPLHVLIPLGMGPIEATLHGKDNREVSIGPDHTRMRDNAAATLELIARGVTKHDAIIVPSGTSTANPSEIILAMKRKDMDQDTFRSSVLEEYREKGETILEAEIEHKWHNHQILAPQLPNSDIEADMVDHTSEASLMEKLLWRISSKVPHPEGIGNIRLSDTRVTLWADHLATETVDSFIHLLNELDKRSFEQSGELFNGNIGAITSRYHVARTYEIAKLLGLENQVVPLISQEVLKVYGYEDPYISNPKAEQFDLKTRWREQKWIRALYQIPEYLLPTLVKIENNQRLIKTLLHLSKIYGNDTMSKFGLDTISLENIYELRSKLSNIIRKNPTNAEWLKEDTAEVNSAIDKYVDFTRNWLSQHGETNNTDKHIIH